MTNNDPLNAIFLLLFFHRAPDLAVSRRTQVEVIKLVVSRSLPYIIISSWFDVYSIHLMLLLLFSSPVTSVVTATCNRMKSSCFLARCRCRTGKNIFISFAPWTRQLVARANDEWPCKWAVKPIPLQRTPTINWFRGMKNDQRRYFHYFVLAEKRNEKTRGHTQNRSENEAKVFFFVLLYDCCV